MLGLSRGRKWRVMLGEGLRGLWKGTVKICKPMRDFHV